MSNDTQPMTPLDAAQAIIDARAGATQGEWYHVQAFQRVEKQRTIHGPVPAQNVDFVASERCAPPFKNIVVPMEGRESYVKSDDMAFIAICGTHAAAVAQAYIDVTAERDYWRTIAQGGVGELPLEGENDDA